jgi:hypothetical protein
VDGLRPTDVIKRLIKRKGASLTWGPGPSNGLGSGATAAFAAAAIAVVVAAASAPQGDCPWVLVAAANPTVAVVVVAADLMVAVVEG